MKLLCVCVLATCFLAPSFLTGGTPPQEKMKPGKERWNIKTGEAEKKPKVVSWDEFVALKDPPDVKKDDPRYQNKRIPEFPNPLNVKEGDIIKLTCWFHLVATESDGDYHVQVSNDSVDGNNCVVVEVPNPDPEYVSSDTIRTQAAAVREWIRAKLLRDASKEPSKSGNVMSHPPKVVITGQLFYDDAHVGDLPRGKRNMKAVTLWEIHPVTAISFAPRSAR